jgi:hypothetical protein
MVKGYARGGHADVAQDKAMMKQMAKADVTKDKAMVKAAVQKHEKSLHKGAPLTKLAHGGYAEGGAKKAAAKDAAPARKQYPTNRNEPMIKAMSGGMLKDRSKLGIEGNKNPGETKKHTAPALAKPKTMMKSGGSVKKMADGGAMPAPAMAPQAMPTRSMPPLSSMPPRGGVQNPGGDMAERQRSQEAMQAAERQRSQEAMRADERVRGGGMADQMRSQDKMQAMERMRSDIDPRTGAPRGAQVSLSADKFRAPGTPPRGAGTAGPMLQPKMPPPTGRGPGTPPRGAGTAGPMLQPNTRVSKPVDTFSAPGTPPSGAGTVDPRLQRTLPAAMGGGPMAMKKGGMTSKQEAKVGKVMGEYKAGELHSGSKSGPMVKSRKQAVAIAMSEAGKKRK